MYHFQLKQDGDTLRVCGSINAMPMDCTSRRGSPVLQDPRQLIEAIEFTTEMLVSPIEFTTEWFTKAQVQMKYYLKVNAMELVLGPAGETYKAALSVTDSDMVEARGLQERRVVKGQTKTTSSETSSDGAGQGGSFDQRVALLAPPLMFQTRAKQKACSRKVTSTFLEGQAELKKAALCRQGESCDFIRTDDIATCFVNEQDKDAQYWGNPARTHGFAEFLYAVDSPTIVRPNKDGLPSVVRTRDFLDGLTTTASVLALFHSPKSGLTTAVELSADVSAAEVKTKVDFLHLGFVDDEGTRNMIVVYTFLFLLIIALIVNAVISIWTFKADRRRHGRAYKKEIADYMMDLLQGCAILAFCIFSLIRAWDSEASVEDIVGDIRRVSAPP